MKEGASNRQEKTQVEVTEEKEKGVPHDYARQSPFVFSNINNGDRCRRRASRLLNT
jgi:hypothetical protein